jgi:hypothetical protein
MCIIKHTVGQLILQKNHISSRKYNRFNMLENSYIRAVNKRFCTNAYRLSRCRLSFFQCPLVDATRPEMIQAVFYDIGYCQAVHVRAETVWFWIIEDRAYIFPVVEIIETLMC